MQGHFIYEKTEAQRDKVPTRYSGSSSRVMPATLTPAQLPTTLPTQEVVLYHTTLPNPHPNPSSLQIEEIQGQEPRSRVRSLECEWVKRPEFQSAYLFGISANLDGIGNEASCFFFSHGTDVFQTDCQLVVPQGQRAGNKQEETLVVSGKECPCGASANRPQYMHLEPCKRPP